MTGYCNDTKDKLYLEMFVDAGFAGDEDPFELSERRRLRERPRCPLLDA